MTCRRYARKWPFMVIAIICLIQISIVSLRNYAQIIINDNRISPLYNYVRQTLNDDEKSTTFHNVTILMWTTFYGM
jgi:hypothetical protein